MFQFRTGFIGKSSPVHFFWGSFDLAVTRFSGRRAPLHPGGVPHLPDAVTQEAYSHEVCSAGLLAGQRHHPVSGVLLLCLSGARPVSLTRPSARARRSTATISANIFCPTTRCALADDPERALMDFLTSTYEAAASLGQMGSRRVGLRRSACPAYAASRSRLS